jgi:hypothetical protein
MYIADLSDEHFESAAFTTKEILAKLETYAIITSHQQPLRLPPETQRNTYTAGATDSAATQIKPVQHASIRSRVTRAKQRYPT